jgi:hypothetical protein
MKTGPGINFKDRVIITVEREDGNALHKADFHITMIDLASQELPEHVLWDQVRELSLTIDQKINEQPNTKPAAKANRAIRKPSRE